VAQFLCQSFERVGGGDAVAGLAAAQTVFDVFDEVVEGLVEAPIFL